MNPTITEPLRVVSFGGGVNSTAMLLLMESRCLLPHLVLFADTGGERPATYEHVRLMMEWCASRGVNFVTVTNAGRGQGDSLEENCLARKELPSLAYGFKGCSVKWKRQPMDRFLRDYPGALSTWEAGGKVQRFIGIDAGEPNRTKLPPDERYEYRYPLADEGWDRDACVAAIKQAGLPIPPKSSCFFCPAMRRNEILEMNETNPDLVARALAIEKNAETHTVTGLGRNWKWADLIRQDKAQLKLFQPASIPCDCMDGGGE